MTFRVLALTVALGIAGGGAPGGFQAQTQPRAASRAAATDSAKAERVAIRTVLATQVAEWNRGDIAAFMEGYWNSPDTEFVSSNGILRGYQNVLERYRKQYPDGAAMGHLSFSELEVNLLAPQVALVVGRYQLKRQNDSPSGVFTLVLKKFPEGWRIINDHTSQTPNQ